MKMSLLLLTGLIAIASCQKKHCYTCSKDLYTDGVLVSTEVVDSPCGLTEKEYREYVKKYPNTVKSEFVPGDYYYYHCDKK